MKTTLLTDFEKIRQIYNLYMKQDFPANELKPLAMIRKARTQGRYDCYGIYDGDSFIGYAFFVKLMSGDRFHYLLDYLAIVQENRNRGCGGELLRQLSELISDADCIIAEVENPDADSVIAETKNSDTNGTPVEMENSNDNLIIAEGEDPNADHIIVDGEDPNADPNEQEKDKRERRLRFYLRNGYRTTGVKATVFGVDYLLLETNAAKPGLSHSKEEIREIYAGLYQSMVPPPMYQTLIKINS